MRTVLIDGLFSSVKAQPLLPALALLTVARPLASPTPRPLVPLLLNIGAFLSISGTMKNRTWLPLIYIWSRCDTLPSRAVCWTSLNCTFMLSSASSSFPRYTWPDESSRVTIWPCSMLAHPRSCRAVVLAYLCFVQ